MNLEFYTQKQSQALISSSRLLKTIIDSENNLKCELYSSNGSYFEAVYDLEDGTLSYITEVHTKRLEDFNHIDENHNFTGY